MAQQYPFGDANDKYKKRLFVETAGGYEDVRARIVEPYASPAPMMNAAELKILSAPSHLHQMGISAYKVALTLLFEDKEAYADYLMWVGWNHKFYDEKGSIYLGTVEGEIKAKPVFAGSDKARENTDKRQYMVEISLILVKKDEYDRKDRVEYQDLVDTDGTTPHWAKANIEQMANLGLIAVMNRDGTPVLYFRPNDFVTRAEFVVFINKTRRLLERIIRE